LAEKQYFHLERRFRELTDAESAQPDALEAFNESLAETGMTWTDLLTENRLVVLAEAGSGKTDEMRHQAQRLAADGKYAFFFTLESVAYPIESLLDGQEQEAFARWKGNGGEPAWFFLDSVDELKLNDRKLEPALVTLANFLGSHREQARVIISCRPSDWRPAVDMEAFRRRLPIPLPEAKAAPAVDPEDFFLSTIEPAPAKSDLLAEEAEERGGLERKFRTVVLLPMSDRQVRSFVEQRAVPECEAFLAEIERRDAWDFARRPLDLLELGQVWSEQRRLGERQEQYETNVLIKLRDDPDRADRNQIDDVKAREGAERLALALMLARKQAFRAGDAILDPGLAQETLDPAEILPNWTPKQRQVLLRRALFDPATLGRVRFHHRSVQEYLAACRLRTLQEKGLSIRQLLRLFFAESYGEEIVIPSRAPVAAWLALSNAPVRRMLTRLEPERLLSLGDPASLGHDTKVGLLESFAEVYGNGTWRGVRVPAPELKRLSTPALAPTVVRLWGSNPANPDVRELLLTLIWQGALHECLDIVSSVAADLYAADYERIVALRAMVACGATEQVSALVADLVASPLAWPDKVVRNVACELFPRFLDTDGLIQLMERTPEPESDVNGFRWSAQRLVETLDSCSPVAINLRNRLADLIWRKRSSDPSFHDLKSDCDHLTPALTSLCVGQLSQCRLGVDRDLVRACVIANRFTARIHRFRGDRDLLREAFEDHAAMRAEAFRHETTLMTEVVPGADTWHRLYYAEHGSLLGQLRDADRPWLEAMLSEDGISG